MADNATEQRAGLSEAENAASRHKDWTENLNTVFYIRFQCGPDYEQAFLCIDDGEPDTLEVGRMSFKQARMMQEGFKAAAILEGKDEIELLRWKAQSRYELLRECQSEFRAIGSKGLAETIEFLLSRPDPARAVLRSEGEA